MTIQAIRYHDISCGHRVANHESKCQHLHGHNYRIHFTCEGHLDSVGRVIDFDVIKEKLCMWLEDNWDHKFLAWEEDELMQIIDNTIGALPPAHGDKCNMYHPATLMLGASLVWLPFNPTAENLAQYLVDVIGPMQLEGTGVTLVSCTIDETRKCSAAYHKE